MRLPDWKQAGITAFILTGIAAFTVFVLRPGGFEGQIGWFFALLPGAFAVANVARFAKILPNRGESCDATDERLGNL